MQLKKKINIFIDYDICHIISIQLRVTLLTQI